MTDHNYQNGIYEQQTASDYDGMQHSRSQIQPDHPAMISVDAYPAPSHGNDYDMHNLVPTNNELFDWNTHDPVYERSAAQFFMNLPSKPASSQSEIVQLRSDRVNEQYGNLTPPEEDAMRDVREDNNPQLKQAGSATDNPKRALDRSERARNAANQRHAKSKRRALKEDQNSDSDPEDSSNDGDDRREKYREKNRAAAAKCRAKKKTHVDKIELDARSLETENAMLKARVRELRNQHAELRDLALQHNPSVANCRCGSLHQYNIGKAAEITSSFNAYASMRSDSLVPQDALHEINLKDRILSNARATYGSMTLDPQAFAGASSFAFAGVNTPQSMQMRSTAEMDDQHQQSSGSARSSARRNLC